MLYTVEIAQPKDLPRIEQIYAYARSFMAKTGNPNQWGNHHPPHDQLVQDIEENTLFVVKAQDTVHGVFYFLLGEDSTYAAIYEGSWRSQTPYGTIHRIAGDGSGGILKAAVAYGKTKTDHIRIDTHADNLVMQKALEKQGFQKRGIIYIADGSPRIAYDLLLAE